MSYVPCFWGARWERQTAYRDERSGRQRLHSIKVRSMCAGARLPGFRSVFAKWRYNQTAYMKDRCVSYRRKVQRTVPRIPSECSSPVCYYFNMVNTWRNAHLNPSVFKCHHEIKPSLVLPETVFFSSAELMEHSIRMSLMAASIFYQALC